MNTVATTPRVTSFAPQFLDHIAEFTALVFNDGRQHHDLRFRWVGQNLIDDLLWRLADQRFSGHRIMRLAHGGEKNSQVIVNFSGRGDGRAGVRAGAALFDGNGR